MYCLASTKTSAVAKPLTKLLVQFCNVTPTRDGLKYNDECSLTRTFKRRNIDPLKNAVFRDVTPCDSCKKRRFVGMYRHHHQEPGTLAVASNRSMLVFLRSVLRLLVTANVVSSSSILVSPMVEATHSSETSVLTRATRRNKPEDGFLHSDRRENLKSWVHPLLGNGR
jgi:hypothetical protein